MRSERSFHRSRATKRVTSAEAHCECAQDGQWGCGRPRSEIHPPARWPSEIPREVPVAWPESTHQKDWFPTSGAHTLQGACGEEQRASIAGVYLQNDGPQPEPSARVCTSKKHRRPEARSSPPAGRSSPPISVLGGGPSGPVVDRAPLARAVPSVANWVRTRDARVKIGRFGQMFCRQNISAD